MGGGYRFTVRFEQAFEIQGALVGKATDGKLRISYVSGGSDASPGGYPAFSFPKGARAILFLSGGRQLVKALPDSPENRKLIAKKADNPKYVLFYFHV